MAHKKIKKARERKHSLIWNLFSRLSAWIYSLFTCGRIGEMLSSRDTLCSKSYIADMFERQSRHFRITSSRNAASSYPKRGSSRVITLLREFVSSLSLNVYGMFFTFYGLTSCIAYTIPSLMNGFSLVNEFEIISAAVLTLASLPLLFSTKSAVEEISGSRFMSRFIFDFLCVPNEKLKVRHQYGGTVYTFIASILAMILGALSIFTHPLFMPAVLLFLIAVIIVFAYPEAGVIITMAVIPFLQYVTNSELVLLCMTIIVGISYFCKVVQKRRTFSLSAETVMVILFCGFIIAGGMFSYGGFKTFAESISAIIIILGGFLITYNLVNTEKMLSVCIKTVTISFLVVCIIGIWEGLYNGLSTRIIDDLDTSIAPISNENPLYILDNGVVFGMFAVLVLPMLLSYMAKRKSIQGFSAVTVLCIVLIVAAWMCSHYEIVVALFLECIIFWFMYSHKTMAAVLFSIIPLGAIAAAYPYAVYYFGFPDISEILMEYMPAGMADSETHLSVIKDVFIMISDGNIFGIGAGDNAFKTIFPAYASQISMGAEHPMSMWLQVLCWSGIFGTVAFVIFVLFMTKRSLGYLISSEKNERRGKILALFCGIAVSMLLGCTYSIWTDARVLYMCWAFSGLLMGYIRLENSENELRRADYTDLEDACDVEITFYR